MTNHFILVDNGLSRMSRTHLHLIPLEYVGKKEQISGMRNSCDAIVIVDVTKAIKGSLT